MITNPGNIYANVDQRQRFLVEESCEKWQFSREKIGIGLCILYHKTCYKKLTRCLYKVNENLENISGNEKSAIFDRSFDTLASEIETNVLKALKVVTMSEV